MSQQERKQRVEEFLSRIDGLPAMPALVQKLEKMISDPDVDVEALASEIRLDPALTASLIRLSNSAYYAPRRPIRSVSEAIVTLGLRTVKDVVLIVVARGFLKVDIKGFRLSAAEIWDHSLLVAALSGKIAVRQKTKVPDDVAFTAGLLHDIGKILLSNYTPAKYQRVVLAMSLDSSSDVLALERKELGFTHVDLGSGLLAQWQMPAELVEAVRFLYEPHKARLNPELASIIHVANALALSSGVGVDIGGLGVPLSDFAIKTLHIKDQEMESYYSHLPELMEELEDLRSF